MRDLGDRVLGLGTFRFIGKRSGIETEGPLAILATYRDGLCTHLKDYGERSRPRSRRAAGVGDVAGERAGDVAGERRGGARAVLAGWSKGVLPGW